MLEAGIIFVAGVWAGGINVIVGSGTLVTFPTLLLFGYPPLVANVSNNLGMVAGGISGIYGYRDELRPNQAILKRLSPASIVGALVGALLLLILPADSFKAIVPVLIAIGILMVVLGPTLQRRAAQKNAELGREEAAQSTQSQLVLTGGIFLLGVYGGYFGAGQGILLVGLMSMVLTTGLQQITAIKNVLATIANAVAALTFIIVAWHLIDWTAVALIGSGAFVGGYVGARIGRKLPPAVLRSIIVIIGVVAMIKILFFG